MAKRISHNQRFFFQFQLMVISKQFNICKLLIHTCRCEVEQLNIACKIEHKFSDFSKWKLKLITFSLFAIQRFVLKCILCESSISLPRYKDAIKCSWSMVSKMFRCYKKDDNLVKLFLLPICPQAKIGMVKWSWLLSNKWTLLVTWKPLK